MRKHRQRLPIEMNSYKFVIRYNFYFKIIIRSPCFRVTESIFNGNEKINTSQINLKDLRQVVAVDSKIVSENIIK